MKFSLLHVLNRPFYLYSYLIIITSTESKYQRRWYNLQRTLSHISYPLISFFVRTSYTLMHYSGVPFFYFLLHENSSCHLAKWNVKIGEQYHLYKQPSYRPIFPIKWQPTIDVHLWLEKNVQHNKQVLMDSCHGQNSCRGRCGERLHGIPSSIPITWHKY